MNIWNLIYRVSRFLLFVLYTIAVSSGSIAVYQWIKE